MAAKIAQIMEKAFLHQPKRGEMIKKTQSEYELASTRWHCVVHDLGQGLMKLPTALCLFYEDRRSYPCIAIPDMSLGNGIQNLNS